MTTYADRSLTVDDVRRVLSPYITFTSGDQFRCRFCPKCGESGPDSNKLCVSGKGVTFRIFCFKCEAKTREVLDELGLERGSDAKYVPPPAAEFTRTEPGRVQHLGKMAPAGSTPPLPPTNEAGAKEYLRRARTQKAPAGEVLYVSSDGEEAEHKRWLRWNGEKVSITSGLRGPNWYLLHSQPDILPPQGMPVGLHEGEKDTFISVVEGYEAFGTAGGASRAKHALINELVGRSQELGAGVALFQDNDNAGVKWSHELLPDLLRQGRRVFWPNPATLPEKASFSDYPERLAANYEACYQWTAANPDDTGKKGEGAVIITALGDTILTWLTPPVRLPGETTPQRKNKREMARGKRREENWCTAAKGWQGELSTQGIGTICYSCGKCEGCQAHWADDKKGYHDMANTDGVRRDVLRITSGDPKKTGKRLTPSRIKPHRESQRQRGKKDKFQVASYIKCETFERESPWDTMWDGKPIDPEQLIVWTLIIEDPLKAGIEPYEAYIKNTAAYCKREGLQLEIEPSMDVSDAFLNELLTLEKKVLHDITGHKVMAITHWNWPRCYEFRPLPQPTMSKQSYTVDTTGMELDGSMVVHLSDQQLAMLSPEDRERKRWELQGSADKRAQMQKTNPELAAMLSTREWMDGVVIPVDLWRELMEIVAEDVEAKAEAKDKGVKARKTRKVDIPGCNLPNAFLKQAIKAFMGLAPYRQAYFEIYRRIGAAPPAEITRLAEPQMVATETLRQEFPIIEPDEPTDEGDDIATATRRSYVPDWYRERHMDATIEFHDPYTQDEANVEGKRIIDEATFALMADDYDTAEYWQTNEWETLWNDRVQPGVYPPRDLLGRLRNNWEIIDDAKAKQAQQT